MQYDEFLRQVQERAGLDSLDDARGLTETVLTTLAEPLSREVTNELAAQLPKELKTLLEEHHTDPVRAMARYSAEEFVNRVKGRLDVTYQQGAELANAVLVVLRQAVSAGTMERVRADLPEDYERLFSGNAESTRP